MRALRQSSTTLGLIRGFLGAEGCAPAPWCSSREVLDCLYRVLHERRRDDGFWLALKQLSSRIEASAREIVLARDFDVLGIRLTEEILDELRASLSGGEDRAVSLAGWFAGTRSARSITAFLTFGALFIPGCSHSPDSCDELAARHYVREEDKPLLCDLRDLVAEANVTDETKQDVLACLAEDGAAARAGLLASWQAMDAQSLAEALRWMAAFRGDCSLEEHSDDDDSDH